MKVKAAHDWLRMNRGEIEYKLGSEKHAFDVYMLTAMLTNTEIEEAKTLAQKYVHHPIAVAIKAYAHELYASPSTSCSIEASRQAGKSIEHEVFWEGLCEMLGITNL